MFEKLAAYLASQLDINEEDITEETTFESLGIDSLDTVEMLMDLEEELGVELEMEEKVATVGELAAFIESKVNCAERRLRNDRRIASLYLKILCHLRQPVTRSH